MIGRFDLNSRVRDGVVLAQDSLGTVEHGVMIASSVDGEVC